jgi:predicted DNA-binding transcriptional regulator YafY
MTGKPEGWRRRPNAPPHPDRPDWVEGSFRFDSEDSALRELLAFCPDVEVLYPVELRAAMAAIGRRITRMHRAESKKVEPN